MEPAPESDGSATAPPPSRHRADMGGLRRRDSGPPRPAKTRRSLDGAAPARYTLAMIPPRLRRSSRWLALITSTILIACPAEPTGSGSVGEIAPRITAKSLAGDYVELSDFRGEVVLVNLWATWCGPCRVELPALERLHRGYHDRGFSVLGVSVDGERGEAQVRKMVSSLGLTFPILLDPATRSSTAYQASGYPTSVLVGRDGRVRWRRAGALTAEDEELLGVIEAALAEPVGAGEPQ